MSAILPLPVVQELGKLALKEAAKGAGKKTAKYVLLEFLFEDEAARKLGEIHKKLDVIEESQHELRQQIASLHEQVGVKASIQAIYNEVHGVVLILKSEEPTDADYKSLKKFLSLSGSNAARTLADDLHQKLFGTGEMTPDFFWTGKPASPEEAPIETAHHDSHVGRTSSAQFNADGSVPVDEYVPKMLALYIDIVGMFAVLGTAIQAARQFLSERNQLGASPTNAPVFSGNGLAGLMRGRALNYVASLAPPAFYLYKKVLKDREWQRIGFHTKSRDRILEWDHGQDRRPVKLAHGGLTPWKSYDGFKPVYADHSGALQNASTSSHHWWHLGPAEGDGPSYSVALRTDDASGRYLGVFRYECWSKTIKGVRHVDHSDEVGLGQHPESGACRWRLHLRRGDDKVPVYFLLESLHASKFLNVHGGESWTTRQIFADGENLRHDDKAFRPTLSPS